MAKKQNKKNIIVLIVSALLVLFITVTLLVVKINLRGTGSVDYLETQERFGMVPVAIIETSFGTYALNQYNETGWFKRREVQLTGLVTGWITTRSHGVIPKLKTYSYQIQNTKTTLEGQLSINNKGQLVLKYEEYWNPERKQTSSSTVYSVVLKGKDTEKLKCIVEKLKEGYFGFTFHDLKMNSTGSGYYLPNSLQEYFDISSYELQSWPYGVDKSRLLEECNVLI